MTLTPETLGIAARGFSRLVHRLPELSRRVHAALSDARGGDEPVEDHARIVASLLHISAGLVDAPHAVEHLQQLSRRAAVVHPFFVDSPEAPAQLLRVMIELGGPDWAAVYAQAWRAVLDEVVRAAHAADASGDAAEIDWWLELGPAHGG